MEDQSKTKQALIQELASLRQRIQEFEYSESKRKCAEDALRESEEKYRAIIENIQEGYHEVDIKGNFTFLNESMCKIIGYEREELLGMNNRQYADEENNRKVYQVYNRVYRTGESVKNFEWQIIRKDGERRDIEVSISLIRDAGGHPAGFRGIVRDTTDRKLAEAELQKTYSLLSSITEGSTDAIYIKDIQGRYLLFNKEAARVTGKKPEEVIGKDDYFLFPADEAKKVMDGDRRVMESGKAMTYEEVVTTTDGKLTYLSTKGSVYNDEGKVSGLFGIARNITERKQTEEDLRNLSQFNHEVISGAAEGIVVYDRELRYLVWNPFMEALTGVPACDVLGQSALDIFPHLREQGVDRLLERALAGETVRSQDTPFHSPATDRSGWVVGTYAPHRNGDGVVIGVIATIQDITERKQAEKALQRSEEKFFKAFQSSPLLVAIRSLKGGRFIDVNDAYIRVTGYSREELTGKDSGSLGITESETVQRVREIINKQGGISNWEDKFKTKTGEVRTGLFSAVVINIGDEPCLLSATQDITDRRKTEDALRFSEEKFFKVFRASPSLMAIRSLKDRHFIDVNDAYIDAMGYSREELIGTRSGALGITDSETTDRVRETLSKQGLVRNWETKIKTKAGDIRTGLFSAVVINIGDEPCILTAFQDITERKRSEEALKKSEEKYRELVDNANSIILKMDNVGNMTFFNEFAQKFFGYSESEIIGKNVVGTIVPEVESTGRDLRVMIEDMGLNPDRYVNNVNENIKSNGDRVWVAWTNKPTYDEHGRVKEVTCIGNDITERRQAEESLRKSEENYRNIFENAVMGIFHTTPDGRYLRANPAGARMYGYDSPQDIVQSVSDMSQQIYANQEDRAKFKEIMESNGHVEGFESEHYRKDGSKIWTVLNSRAVRDNKGRTLYYETTIEDITERVRLEAQFRQAQKMEAIGTLAGGIAHDFNNILSAILGYTDMALTDRKADDPHRHYLEQVYKAGERARDLVKQILTFSRQQEQEKKPVLIALIIKEGIRLLRSSLPTTIRIGQNIKDMSATVLADPTQIHQILMNLCTNAAHAMREKGGTLDIQLVREVIESVGTSQPLNLTTGNYAKLTVSDTGHGIDATIIDRIFDPFFTTKGPGEGTGLGLSVVYGIVRDHGGTIDVFSEPGKGTTVTVYFPLIEAEEPAEERRPEAIPEGSERILLIDDEAALVELGSTMLISLGYQVTSRTSSIEALEAFRANSHGYDLVITDMTMPNIRGDELARELLKIRPDIPIILCTGFSEMISEEKANKLGIRRLVMKPISKKNLAIAIRDALRVE